MESVEAGQPEMNRPNRHECPATDRQIQAGGKITCVFAPFFLTWQNRCSARDQSGRVGKSLHNILVPFSRNKGRVGRAAGYPGFYDSP